MKAIFNFGGETLEAVKGWIADRLEAADISPKKLIEYCALFVVLWAIYFCYFRSLARTPEGTQIEINLSLTPAILKFIFCTGWPFAFLACLDPDWRSKDSAHVAVAAYASYCFIVMHVRGCPLCILGMVVLFVPLLFSAFLLHGMGSWCRSARVKK